MMRCLAIPMGLVTLTLVGTGGAARALVVAPPPGPTRVLNADAVLVGRVLALEPQDVIVAGPPGSGQKDAFRIAAVQVGEALRGAKDAKTVRVGFPVPRADGAPGGRAFFLPGVGRLSGPLTPGQHGLLLLTRHPRADFYVVPIGSYLPSMGNEHFESDVGSLRKLVRVMADPKASLRSKDPQERFLAAAVLVSKYRTPPRTGRPVKQEPLDAAESRQILASLADADWAIPQRDALIPNPLIVFNQLGLGTADGWMYPRKANQEQIVAAMRAWLREHAATYRVRRFVAEK
jgi:hypothetical protein